MQHSKPVKARVKAKSKVKAKIEARPPDVTITANFVPYGYQVDYYCKGQHLGTACRDFGGSYKIVDLAELFVAEVEEAVERFRKGADTKLEDAPDLDE